MWNNPLSAVAVARLLRPRGIKGEISALPLTDRPERFDSLTHVLAGGRALEVENVWWHGEKLILKFAGVDSISEAETLAGLEIEVPAEERVALEEGAFFHSDLIGCELRDRSTGASLGLVHDVLDNPGQLLLDVRGPDGREILVPFARAICVRIDIAARLIEADLPDGLATLNRTPGGA